jgi:taurine dioxygenase
MTSIEPIGKTLGATIAGIDLAVPLSQRDLGEIVVALGRFGLVRFPGQKLEPHQLAAFSAHFGQVQPAIGKASRFVVPGMPAVSVLSNIVENGHPIGSVDVGLAWHTDMVYNKVPGFANILYSLKVPHRDGLPRGGTLFSDLQLAYDNLPDAMKTKLENARGVYTGEEYQGGKSAGIAVMKPRVSHPLVMQHPISGKNVLYCDPSHVSFVDGVVDADAAEILDFIKGYLSAPEFQLPFHWTKGDVLIWDNLRTLHRAVVDYDDNEHRLLHRCQVLGDKVFDSGFVQSARSHAGVAA